MLHNQCFFLFLLATTINSFTHQFMMTSRNHQPIIHPTALFSSSERATNPDLQIRYISHYLQTYQDPYDPETNPNGAISLGVAENRLVTDELIRKLEDTPLKFKPNVENQLGYRDFHGSDELKRVFAGFLQRYVFVNPSIDDCDDENLGRMTPGNDSFEKEVGKSESSLRLMRRRTPIDQNLLLCNGCTTAILVCAMLFCDSKHANRELDDAIMYFGPRYPGFFRNIQGLPEVRTVECKRTWDEMVRKILPDDKRLSDCIAHARKHESKRVRALLLTSPDNPTGAIFSRVDLERVAKFCKRNDIVFVSDEIYAANAFFEKDDGGDEDDVDDDSFNKISRKFHSCHDIADIVLYSLSKDFGAAGLGMGCIYSQNAEILSGLQKFLLSIQIPVTTSLLVEAVLSDERWVHEYLHKSNQRLKTNRHLVLTALNQMNGIRYVQPDTGMFVWVDLAAVGTKTNCANSFQLMELILNECKVFLTPCTEFHDEFQLQDPCAFEGSFCFRICYGATTLVGLKEAMGRLRDFFLKYQ